MYDVRMSDVGMKSLMFSNVPSPLSTDNARMSIRKLRNDRLSLLFFTMPISAIPDTSLADFFPRTTKLCVKPSAEFFKCLSEKSVKSNDADVEAGVRGLSQCIKEKKIYETCMLKNDAKINDPKRHRVRE